MTTGLSGTTQLTGVTAGAHTLGGYLARADHSKVTGSDAAARAVHGEHRESERSVRSSANGRPEHRAAADGGGEPEPDAHGAGALLGGRFQLGGQLRRAVESGEQRDHRRPESVLEHLLLGQRAPRRRPAAGGGRSRQGERHHGDRRQQHLRSGDPDLAAPARHGFPALVSHAHDAGRRQGDHPRGLREQRNGVRRDPRGVRSRGQDLDAPQQRARCRSRSTRWSIYLPDGRLLQSGTTEHPTITRTLEHRHADLDHGRARRCSMAAAA